MQTTLYSYRLHIGDAADAKAYDAIVAKMKARGTKCFSTVGPKPTCFYHEFASGDNGAAIDLETKFIFNNQWNTAPIPGVSEKGIRVFDWAEYAAEAAGTSPNFKCGHYIELTDEMLDARNKRHACGYCGKQFDAPNVPAFCPSCIDSEYLDEQTLLRGATRPYPVRDAYRKWRPLTDAEKETILPQYKNAQIHGATERGKARTAKERRELHAEYERTMRNAATKLNGFTWLMDHGLNTTNIIYYEHTDTFTLGWREAIGENLRPDWQEKMAGFPYKWKFA
jgi:hypothetical protein